MRVTEVPEALEFILLWGEMGTHWGVNRSVSQVHALLYLSRDPLHAEDICEMLGLARSNVSTALKELQSYNIVRRTHVSGDRRDHFIAETELWDMFMAIVAERKRREIDPVIVRLDDINRRLSHRDDAPNHVRERIGRMQQFIARLTDWYSEVRTINRPTLVAIMRLGKRIARFIPRSSDG